MKRVATTIVWVLSWAVLPGLAAGQEAPVPPTYGTPTPLEPDDAAAPIGTPTPAEPEPADAGDEPNPASDDEPQGGIAESASEPEPPANVDHDSHEPQAEPGKPAPLPEGGASDASPAAIPEVPTEVVVERYPNRRTKIERHVVQDAERNFMNHGPWTMWAPDGTMIAKGRYEWGNRQGQWSRLYTDIKDDRIASFARHFTAPFAGIAEFADDKLHGTWKIVDAKQREVRSWEFKHGRLNGNALTWLPNGRKQSETTFEDGMMTGYKEWDSNGKLINKVTYKDGRTTLPYSKTYPSGEKHYEGQFLSPRQIYKATIDFWNGVVEVQLSKKEGEPKRHGKWTEWYPGGGKKFEGEFEEDKPIGRHNWWFANGQKRAEGEFKAGKEHGQWTWWHENGLKHLDGHFLNGVQTGTWVRWKPDGKVHEVQEHHLGPAKEGVAKHSTADDIPQDVPPTAAEPAEGLPTPAEITPTVRRPLPRSVPQPQLRPRAQSLRRPKSLPR